MAQFSARRDLYECYVAGDSGLVNFYGFSPQEWDAALEKRALHPPASWSTEEIAELQQWNEHMGNSSAALQNIARLGQPGTYVVATGQQAGLLAGPLYTLYKSLTAAKLARELSSSRGATVVPLFWVASEDHDFDEVRTVSWINRDGELVSFRYTPDNYQPGISVFDIPVEPSLDQLIARFETETFHTEFKDDLLQTLRRTIQESENLEDLFCRLLLCLIKHCGLVLVSPRLKCVREKARPIFERELTMPGESTARILQTSQALQHLGYRTALHRDSDDLNCFIYHDHLRCKVKWKNDAIVLLHPFTGDEMERMTGQEALALLARSPSRFSANVVTRSIVQDAVFPTVGYVGGPGEVSYFALLRECYAFYDVFMPIIYPRLRVTLIEPRAERSLKGLGTSVQEFLTLSTDELYRRALASHNGGQHERVIKKAQQDMLGRISELRAQIASGDPAILSSLDKMERMVRTSFDKLTERYFEALKKQNRTLLAHVMKADCALRPAGKQQERVLNPFVPFVQNYGWQFVQWLDDSLKLDPAMVHYLFLSGLPGHSGGQSPL